MRFIPTRIHGVIDYIVGAALILAPFVLGFANGGAAMWVPIIIGASVILYSLFTDYEAGAFPRLSMPAHLSLDVVGGIILAVSPWLFGFSDVVWLPHLLVGLFEIGAGLTTETTPSETTMRRGIDTTREPRAV